jgi:ABC-type phosphate transport system auxiliary subunit
MSQNKIVTIMVALLVLAAAIIIRQSFKVQNLNHQLERTVRDLKKKDKQLELKGDSLKVVIKKNAELDTLWSGIVRDQLAALEQERKKVSDITKKYEKAKNRPIPNWTNHQLDSLLSVIIR